MKEQLSLNDDQRMGIIAGWGRYPIVVAERLVQQGYKVYCLGVKDHANPVLKDICHSYQPIGLAQLGKAIRYFQRHGVQSATMAGKIHKVLLFQRFCFLKHLPDWHAIRTFYPHYISQTRDRKDDTMLGTIVEAFARFGIRFAPATDFIPTLLVKEGKLSGNSLTLTQRRDIEFGWHLAREMGRLDVGQSVAVKGRAVLAVEAVEGTDECIRRAGKLCNSGDFTVVKTAKPQQDMRFDVPTIGVGTLRTMVETGANTLAIEAGKTIILDEDDVIDFARKHRLTIVALKPESVSAKAA